VNDTSWITEISRDIAEAALQLLDEIVEQMDLLNDPVVISPYVYNMGIGQEDNVRGWKLNTLGMLQKRGVLRGFEYRHERTMTGGGEGIWIDADEAEVRETRRLLHERLDERPKTPQGPTRSTPAEKGRVFLVCGRDEAATQMVARFLERLGIKPVILEEQTNQGRTIIEKLEHHATTDYAVVLLTPDDEGRLRGRDDALSPRPRQNVVGELFYFTAKLGRSRVCALIKGEMELPSDYAGFGYTTMDEHDGWQVKLAREMRDAEVQADYSKVL
jgi:predicted nucleotide-binding protein